MCVCVCVRVCVYLHADINPFPLQVEKPLEAALKFLAPLQLHSRKRIEPHLLAYAIHSRRCELNLTENHFFAIASVLSFHPMVSTPSVKFLLMLQSLKRARAVDPEDGGLHEAVVDFALAGVYIQTPTCRCMHATVKRQPTVSPPCPQ